MRTEVSAATSAGDPMPAPPAVAAADPAALVALEQTIAPTWPGSFPANPTDPSRRITGTIWLRPSEHARLDVARVRDLGATPPPSRTYAARKELATSTDADEASFARVRDYCARRGIEVVERHWRSLTLRGTIGAIAAAFGTACSDDLVADGRTRRSRSGPLRLPAAIEPLVHGAFGLETWPRGTPTAVPAAPALTGDAPAAAPAATAPPLDARAVAELYAFPPSTGRGQRIGIVQFGGTFDAVDFRALFEGDGSPVPVVESLVRVDDAAPAHAGHSAFDDELLLDVQIAASLSPGAEFVIFDAPHGERGFLDVVRTAIFDTRAHVDVLSISYGWPEPLWTAAALEIIDDLFAAAALVGVAVFCASGDSGDDVDDAGRPQVRAPASSRFAIACGGTVATAAGDAFAEHPWPASGGGASAIVAAEAWQAWLAEGRSANGAASPGRAVPDVAGQVVPGFHVIRDGVATFASGTSAIAPMWAALAARLGESLGGPIGFIAPLLYERACVPDAFRAIGERAWNPRTGLGSPNGRAVLELLRGR